MSEAKRPFGVWTASALVVGGMIGAGIYVQPAEQARFGWSGLAGWLGAIPSALILAFVLTRLTLARPKASGAVEIVGESLGPLPGVLVGWSYWMAILSANAIIALTAVRYFGTFLPLLTDAPINTALAAVALVWLITLLNLGGARGSGRFQVVTTLLKLLPLIAVILILAMLGAGNPTLFASYDQAPLKLADFTTTLTLAFYPMVGFEAAAITAARVEDPARNVLRATLWGTCITGLIYLVISNGIAFALPPEQVGASKAPIALFVERFWGHGPSLAVAAFASISAIGCLNGWVLVQGELPLGMARAKLMPAFLAHTTTRDVPVNAVLLASTFVTALILSTATPALSGALTFMLQLTTASTVWFYAAACVVAIRMGLVRPVAWLGLGAACWVLWGSGITPLLLSIALMLTAVPLYFLAIRKPVSS